MKPTKECLVYPDTFKGYRPALPMLHMTDEEIDGMIETMRIQGKIPEKDIPRTQYGGRVACETLFALERYKGEQPVRKEFWRTDDLR